MAQTIYFKYEGSGRTEVGEARVISIYNDGGYKYYFVTTEDIKSPAIIEQTDIATKEEVDVWQTIHAKEEEVVVLEGEIDELREVATNSRNPNAD